MIDVKKDFPIFEQHKTLIYLDSAATTQKPKSVIDAISSFYSSQYGTVHRAIYDLSLNATALYENVRIKIATFLHANRDEIVFCRGTTDGINIIANSFSHTFLKEGDIVLLSHMEHHSNIVPWQLLQRDKKIQIKVIPVTQDGEIDLQAYQDLLDQGARLVSITHASNVLGTINPIKAMVRLAHQKGAKVLVDGAQGVQHHKIDVKDLDCDFYVFSGHKMYGPTGIGIVYGKKELLDQMPPIQGGGDMIEKVTFEKTTFQKSPIKFEAGTPMIAEVIGLGAAIDYLNHIGMENILAYEKKLTEYLIEKLKKIDRLKILGNPKERGALVSFALENLHPLDIATFLNLKNIAIRSGHLCAQPILSFFGYEQLSRISLGVYNSLSDIDLFIDSFEEIIRTLK